jgi:hypothetical protein
MLQLFRTDQAYQVLLLIGYALLLRADLLATAPAMDTPGGGLFSEALFAWLGDHWPMRHGLALLLVLANLLAVISGALLVVLAPVGLFLPGGCRPFI